MDTTDFEAKTIATYDDNANDWASSHAVVNDWLWAIETFKTLLPSGSVLEIGCGGGRDAAELMKTYDYVGTDASAGMVRVAQSLCPTAAITQHNVYDLSQLGRTFDGFWACAVLLHVPRARIDEALQSIHSVLNPGAIGMISIKNGDKDDFEIRDKDGAHEERLFIYWKKQDFERVLGSNGFTVVDYVYKPVAERTNWHIFFVKKVRP